MKHLLASLTFALLAALWSFPLAQQLSTHLPGEVVGDNVTFLWNLWWMRQAGTHFFFSPDIFAPFGADLALHTHTALQAAFAATALRQVDVVTAQNLVVIGTLALNGICSYGLAWDRTRSFAGAVVAGVIFAGSPFISAQMLGHFNLISAWPIPLFALCLLRALERRSGRWAVATGVALAALGYTDYYYVVYCLVLTGGLLVWRSQLLAVTLRPQPLRPRLTVALAAGAIVIVGLSTAIVLSGGVDATVAGVRIRASGPGNLLTIGWLLLGIAAWQRLRPTLHFNHTGWSVVVADMRRLLPAATVFLVAMLPVLSHVVRMVSAGDYSAPAHQWRSGPAGVDVLTLVLGNPFNPLTGDWTRRAYLAFGFDHVEGVGWIGLVPTGVLLWATVRAVRDRLLRPLVVCAWCYLVWAFGSWLTVGGVSTGLILPANFFGFVPVLSNARIPGRALVVVFLAVGLLTARLIASLPRERQGRLAAMLALVLVIDFCPAPVATVALDRPAIYAAIPPENGVVLELPMGLRDGFGEIGAFDERTLLHQMTHGHPLVGGFLARLPQSIKRRYADLPVIRSLLAMSDGQSGPTPEDMALSSADATQALKNVGVRYVVLDHGAASPQLSAFVASLHLSTLQRDGSRELLLLDEQ